MGKKSSVWYIPPDWVLVFSLLFVIPAVPVLADTLLPALSLLKTTDAVVLFYVALGFGVTGSILLFFARVPLYRQRGFGTFGPRGLLNFHRKLYWLAYFFVAVCVLLFAIVWLKTK
ncbi:MAG TPA: hypothetical protein VMJ12_14060 [Candidatus Acidoferrales bacterium]|nr:hypothetical protein [Candidatus Acidoferrales bacterium]